MSAREAEEFESLINSDTHKENECREYLQYVRELLVKTQVIDYIYVETERIENPGRSDYIITALIDEGGEKSVKSFLWELKSPQCYIFEKDNESRLKPTKELIDAENKLLHYYYSCKGSDLFRQQYGISSTEDVKIGGIIIGSTKTKVRGDYDEEKKTMLYRTAKYTRDIMWRTAEIKLLTWNDILNMIKSSDTKDQEIIGDYAEAIEIVKDIEEIKYDEMKEGDYYEYNSIFDKYMHTCPWIDAKIRCECKKDYEVVLDYQGVVEAHEKSMGAEVAHLWLGMLECEECGENYQINLEVWEYPPFFLELAQFVDIKCEILNTDEISEIIGIKIE